MLAVVLWAFQLWNERPLSPGKVPFLPVIWRPAAFLLVWEVDPSCLMAHISPQMELKAVLSQNHNTFPPPSQAFNALVHFTPSDYSLQCSLIHCLFFFKTLHTGRASCKAACVKLCYQDKRNKSMYQQFILTDNFYGLNVFVEKLEKSLRNSLCREKTQAGFWHCVIFFFPIRSLI